MHSPHRTLRHVMAPAALVFTLLVAACGSDGGLSESEYLKKGNAICEAANAKIDGGTAGFPTDGPPTLDDFSTFANETLIPTIRKEIDDLAKLDPPSKLDKEVDEMITAARSDLAKVEADVKADLEAFMTSDADPFAEANTHANAIGLTVCGQA